MNAARILAYLTPVLLSVVGILLTNVPVSMTLGLVPPPVLALAPIYFWTLLRPDLLPPFAVLALGLLEDLMSGGPPGLWAAGFLGAYALADRQRDVFAGLIGFGAVIGFATAMFAAAGIVYLLGSLLYWQFAPVAPMLLESVVTIILYPLIALLMGWLQHRFIGPLRSDA